MTLLPTGANGGLQLRGFRFFTASVASFAIPVLPLPHCSVQFERFFSSIPGAVSSNICPYVTLSPNKRSGCLVATEDQRHGLEQESSAGVG